MNKINNKTGITRFGIYVDKTAAIMDIALQDDSPTFLTCVGIHSTVYIISTTLTPTNPK